MFVLDSCAQKVCLNGGTPVGGITICECKYPPGFQGPNCERGQNLYYSSIYTPCLLCFWPNRHNFSDIKLRFVFFQT